MVVPSHSATTLLPGDSRRPFRAGCFLSNHLSSLPLHPDKSDGALFLPCPELTEGGFCNTCYDQAQHSPCPPSSSSCRNSSGWHLGSPCEIHTTCTLSKRAILFSAPILHRSVRVGRKDVYMVWFPDHNQTKSNRNCRTTGCLDRQAQVYRDVPRIHKGPLLVAISRCKGHCSLSTCGLTL